MLSDDDKWNIVYLVSTTFAERRRYVFSTEEEFDILKQVLHEEGFEIVKKDKPDVE